MIPVNDVNIDEETISKLGLKLYNEPLTSNVQAPSRVFKYPHLKKVFIMESDLYGNKLPKDFCFIAFYGKHGLIGEQLSVEELKNSTVLNIKSLVQHNNKG